jgi:hypothetical protein
MLIRPKRYARALHWVGSEMSQELCAGRGDPVARHTLLHHIRRAKVKFKLNRGEVRKLQREAS